MYKRTIKKMVSHREIFVMFCGLSGRNSSWISVSRAVIMGDTGKAVSGDSSGIQSFLHTYVYDKYRNDGIGFAVFCAIRISSMEIHVCKRCVI